MNTKPMTIAVVIATKGRPEILAATLDSIAKQTLLPEQLILSATSTDDIPPLLSPLLQVETIIGLAGLPIQRNAGRICVRADAQFVFFFDDDLELATDYLEVMVQAFNAIPEVGLLGGRLLADGGITRSEAKKLLSSEPLNDSTDLGSRRSLYGNNMCVRADICRKVAFDENLRLYGWMEDFDWSVRAGEYGAIMFCPAARAVHLSVSVGRVSGSRFGFAQVMNPYYLHKKGTLPSFREVMMRHWFRLLTANLWGFVRMDRRVDRWGRLRGNFRAYCDICRGRSDPKRIELV